MKYWLKLVEKETDIEIGINVFTCLNACIFNCSIKLPICIENKNFMLLEMQKKYSPSKKEYEPKLSKKVVSL